MSIASEHVENLADHLYKYKDSVPIPPPGMVDDTIGISHCGLDTVITTAHLNSKTNTKKLQYGENKCHKHHLGKNTNIYAETQWTPGRWRKSLKRFPRTQLILKYWYRVSAIFRYH